MFLHRHRRRAPSRSLFLLLLLLLSSLITCSSCHSHSLSHGHGLFRLAPHRSPSTLAAINKKSSPVPSDRLSRALARDRARHTRILLSAAAAAAAAATAAENPHSFPLGGTADPNIAGLYFTEIELGTPPIKYYVQVDTGSDLLWVNCASCRTCPTSTQLGVHLALYDPKSSTTSQSVSCGDSYCVAPPQGCVTEDVCIYQLGYGDGSSSQGYFVRDALQLNNAVENTSAATNATIAFGCGTSQGGELQNSDQALDGIMGFGQSNLSVISQLKNEKVSPAIFAHCLVGEGDGGGILIIGNVEAPGIVYTPIIPDQPHYNVNLMSINVNGVSTSVNSEVKSDGSTGTIIDSGTTLAYFSDDVYNHVQSAILNGMRVQMATFPWEGMTCVSYSGSVDDVFPSVTLTFEGKGAKLTLKPHEYMIQVEGEQITGWCIGFQSPGTNKLNLNILGDLVLKDRLFVYDLEHSTPRIGWVDYDCTTNVTVLSSTGQEGHVSASAIPIASIGSTGHMTRNGGFFQAMVVSLLFMLLLWH